MTERDNSGGFTPEQYRRMCEAIQEAVRNPPVGFELVIVEVEPE